MNGTFGRFRPARGWGPIAGSVRTWTRWRAEGAGLAWRRFWVLLAWLIVAGSQPARSGLCETADRKSDWRCLGGGISSRLEAAREAAFWASRHELCGRTECVELYYQAATLSGLELVGSLPGEPAWEIHHESLAGLIRAAQTHRRYHPCRGILVHTPKGPRRIPIDRQGFAWEADDFSRLVIADATVRSDLQSQPERPGVGVPLIVVRQTGRAERFHHERSYFAATAVLKPVGPSEGGSTANIEDWLLELSCPHETPLVEIGPCAAPLAGDISAPTRYMLNTEKRVYLLGFLQPGVSAVNPKLIMIEPYQPGKIPVVFVHGLLSDPLTWGDLYDSLRADPVLNRRYQFWAFQYPTGENFLRSGARLRRELHTAVGIVCPEGDDTALSEMVIVGHSMGGLVAKLQVTSSGDRLWRSVARRPLDQIVATDDIHQQLAEQFCFEPVPYVRRVVFIGTPHDGSGWANRTVGRIGSRLVRIGSERDRQFEQLRENNPGLFQEFVGRRIPTSVDMLEPDNPILDAMELLPVGPNVACHSIIGTGGCRLGFEPSDGVVPVKSARTVGVLSERFVDSGHEALHRAPETVAEVARILHEHLRCSRSAPSAGADRERNCREPEGPAGVSRSCRRPDPGFPEMRPMR